MSTVQDVPQTQAPPAPRPGLDRLAFRLLSWDMLSAYGDKAAFAAARSGRSTLGNGPEDVSTVPDFDVREALGKKGTRTFDRHTGLFVKSASNAIAEAGLSQELLAQAAIIHGTATGSLSSIQDFVLDTVRQERPYLVNPAHFPNATINCAAGQCAIWHGVKGPNATVSAGAQSFYAAARLAVRWAARGYAKRFVVGAVEEVTPAIEQLRRVYAQETGRPAAFAEGAVACVLEAVDPAASPDGDLVLGVRLRTAPASGVSEALHRLVLETLQRADVSPQAVGLAVTKSGPGSPSYAAEQAAVAGLPGARLDAHSIFGPSYSASGGMQLALMAQETPPGAIAVAVSASSNGSLACMVFRKGP